MVVDRENCVAPFVAVTDTPVTADPEGSVTNPASEATPACENRGALAQQRMNARKIDLKTD